MRTTATAAEVGLGDRLRAWLRGEPSGRGGRGGAPRARGGGRDRSSPELETLEAFARSRRGVEAYLEPRTNLYALSVLLVADDGEYLRRPVPDAVAVRRLCERLGLPLYDAKRVGYPRRVRDYDRGVRPDPVDIGDLPPWPDGDADPGPPPAPADGDR
jgi:hypothetical protein